MLKRLWNATTEIRTCWFLLLIIAPFVLVPFVLTITGIGYWMEPVEEGERIVFVHEHGVFPKGSVLTVVAKPGSEEIREKAWITNPHRKVQAFVERPDGGTATYILWLDDYYELRYEMRGAVNFWARLNNI